MTKRFRLATSTSYDRGETRYWRDYVKFRCYPPSDDNVRCWPSKPAGFAPRLVNTGWRRRCSGSSSRDSA
jgi:hypothetical protein